ncbi:ubiquitin-like domain-containing protein [Nocardiopsis sp. N85]|uniref:resuscitation-promoting factor n=1 Tax=Nocardiopsis sp. N85 TaxID=3029400 RepID=UPI00237F9671|nr:resuscitation-promoting factor [Nocardiopsis sp. N85]MDE3724432.1 ubiquitin-like domain-containing protein [Nocardiopsis sp. N85]
MPRTRTTTRRRPRGRRRARRRLPPPLLAAVIAAALALGAGGTALAAHKTVVLDVNGTERTVHTFGGTVADTLDAADITLADGDLVAPALDAPITSGEHVLVRSPRDLTVELDGHPLAHSVNAATLGEALRQIGLDPEGVALSTAHDTPIPTDGLTVTAERAPRMVVLRDTVRTETRSTGDTVADVLDAAHVTLGEHDIVTPDPDTAAAPDMTVRVVPVLGEPVTEEIPIEAEIVERENPDLPEGERETVTEPEDGVKRVVTATVLHHGEEVERVLEEEVVTAPVEGVVDIGTKAPEGTPPAGGGAAADLNWSALAQCESGGNPSAVNSAGGYHGLYQFSPSTWQSVGGTGLPSEATPQEQTQRAQQLYNAVGGDWQSQWPHCGVHLFD